MPTSKRSLPMDDKIRVNTLHMMEMLDKAYTMTTKDSPEKILTMTQNQFKARYSLNKRKSHMVVHD